MQQLSVQVPEQSLVHTGLKGAWDKIFTFTLSNMGRAKGHWGMMVRAEEPFLLYRKGPISLTSTKLSVNPLMW